MSVDSFYIASLNMWLKNILMVSFSLSYFFSHSFFESILRKQDPTSFTIILCCRVFVWMRMDAIKENTTALKI